MAAIFEEFANGDDFNASDWNTYAMRQAIIACDNQTDRDAILTPQEGMTVYRKDLNALQTYTGSAWYTHSGEYPYGCKAIRSSTVSIPHATETVVTWNSEEYDYGNFHDNVTNANRITIQENGIYLVSGFAQFASSISASAIRFRKGGTTTLAFCYMPGSVTSVGDVFGSYVGKFNSGDYIEMLVFQSNGSSAARNLNEATSYFSATKL